MTKLPCISIMGMSSVHNLDNPATSAFNDLENKRLSELFPRIPMRRIPRYARMGLLAGAMALENIEHSEKVGLVVGSAYAGIQMSMDFMDSILDAEPRLSSPTAFSHAVNNMGAGLLSLYLNLQGPCHTITQFELSFAGAIQVASTIINADRAKYVLVGCMDECEQRFNKTCLAENLPIIEGAIFFLVGKANEKLPHLSVSWDIENNAKPKAQSPLEGTSALRYAIATQKAIEAKATQDIICKSRHMDTCANIHVRS